MAAAVAAAEAVPWSSASSRGSSASSIAMCNTAALVACTTDKSKPCENVLELAVSNSCLSYRQQQRRTSVMLLQAYTLGAPCPILYPVITVCTTDFRCPFLHRAGNSSAPAFQTLAILLRKVIMLHGSHCVTRYMLLITSFDGLGVLGYHACAVIVAVQMRAEQHL